MMSLHAHRTELFKHYSLTSFVRLSMSCSAGKELWGDLSTALQPLSKLPFRLEYNRNNICIVNPEGSSSQGSSTDSPCKSSRSLDNVRLVEGSQEEVRGVRHSLSEQILMKTSEKTKDFVKERMKGLGADKTKELLREKAVEKTMKTQQYLVNASSMLLKNMLQGSRNDAIAWESDPKAERRKSEPKAGSTFQRLFAGKKSKSLDYSHVQKTQLNCNSASIDSNRDDLKDSHSNPESISSSTECAPTQYSLSSLRSSSESSTASDHREPLKKSRFSSTIRSFGPTLIKLFDNVLLDSTKENKDQSGNTPRRIKMSQSVPVKLSDNTAKEEEKGTAQIILDGADGEVRRRPGAAELRKRRDIVNQDQQRLVVCLFPV